MQFETSQWCTKHWKVIAEDINYNGILAALFLIEELLKDKRFMKMCGYNPEAGIKAKTSLINQKMAEVSPVCCFLGDDIMNSIYDKCKYQK